MPEAMVSVEITQEVDLLIRETIAAGRYDVPSDAICDALLLRRAARDDLAGYDLDEIRLLGDAGEASGPGEPLDMEAIKRAVMRGSGRL